MGLLQLLFLCGGVVLLIAAAIWVIDYLAPEHPTIIDRLLWVLAAVIVAFTIWRALGGHDIAIPKVL
jgi:hypothetical protein